MERKLGDPDQTVVLIGGNEPSPLVSIVIPAYQCAASIGFALESVFAQTFSNYEVLVVDDGSPDQGSLQHALRPYQSRIRYIRQDNRGPSGARNHGILQAKAPYIAFLDSDDVWSPDHLATQMKMLQKNSTLDLVYADSILTRGGRKIGHAFGLEPQHPPVSFEKLLTEECTVGTSSTVARRQALIDAGLFDERFRCCEDFDLWLRMAFRGAQMDYDPGLHVSHALSAGSLSGDRMVMKRARIEVYEKTGSSLPVSSAQKTLICSLIAKTEAECQTDLTKQFLHAGEYAKALESAEKASTVKRNWKMRATVFGLRRSPRLFRIYHLVYERLLRLRNRMRTMTSARTLHIASGNSSVRLM